MLDHSDYKMYKQRKEEKCKTGPTYTVSFLLLDGTSLSQETLLVGLGAYYSPPHNKKQRMCWQE